MLRRHWASPLLVLLCLRGSVASAQSSSHPPTAALLARARALLARTPIIDSHNDLPTQLIDSAGGNPTNAHLAEGDRRFKTDIPRLRAGHVGAQFWSVWADPDSAKTRGALPQALREIDVVHRLVERHPDVFVLASTAADIERIERSGKIAALMGVEGGHMIDNSLAALRDFYRLGVRYMTLTHWKTIDWADAATDSAAHGGLTEFGKDVVREMNRLGMFIDLSHVSADVMRQAIAISAAPVIFSHSSARALNAHPRNVPDDVLAMLPKNGGVVMVNFYSSFVTPEGAAYLAAQDSVAGAIEREVRDTAERSRRIRAWRDAHPEPRGTVATVADHIDHIRQVAGIDHVGIGSDFDGVSTMPVGLEDVSTYPVLIAELLRRGYSDADVEKIAGKNLLRAMREMERAAVKLRRAKT